MNGLARECLHALVRDWVDVTIGLGANLGDARSTVLGAMHAIEQLPEVRCAQRSSLYCSTPVHSSGPDYVNAVLQIQTRCTAPKLLTELQMLEASAGRQRPYPNAPRTLDLDILLYGQAYVSSAALTVPHPRMWTRAFVLVPLAQIAPGIVSAAQLRSVAEQAIWRID